MRLLECFFSKLASLFVLLAWGRNCVRTVRLGHSPLGPSLAPISFVARLCRLSFCLVFRAPHLFCLLFCPCVVMLTMAAGCTGNTEPRSTGPNLCVRAQRKAHRRLPVNCEKAYSGRTTDILVYPFPLSLSMHHSCDKILLMPGPNC